MKKGIRKTISVIAILTMTFQIGMPLVPGLTSKVFATNTTIPVATEKLQATVGEDATTVLSESTDTAQTEEISRNYEIKEEETWDVSANGDGSVIAKWTLKDRTLTISGTGEMKDWNYDESDWHNSQYTDLIEKAIIEKGISNIGMQTFYGCSSLTSINILDSVTSIGRWAFSGCSSLTSINIPESVTSIEDYTFRGCSSLKSIDIPEGVTDIEYDAFYGCSSLKNIDIPERVINIDNSTFHGCSSLESINVDVNNMFYASEDGILFNKGKTEIIKYPAGKKDIKEYIIPSTVASIEDYTFAGCSTLEGIEIPEKVTSIGRYTFDECSSLKRVNIPEEVTSIGLRAFYGCSSLKSINIPERLTSIDDYAFYDCNSLENIVIPEKVSSIGSMAFLGCDSLKSINIPNSVVTIGVNAFENTIIIYTKADSKGHEYAEEKKYGYILIGTATEISTNYEIKEEESWDVSANEDGSVMAKWTLEDRTLRISGNGEMKDWNYDESDWHNSQYTDLIEKAIIEKGISNIGMQTFYECSSLKSINIPEGLTKISNIYVFSGCSSLESIDVDTNNSSYMSEDGILFNKMQTKIIRYPAGKKDIKDYVIPTTVTSINDAAFSGCSYLESINIPEKVRRIEDSTFSGCSSLKNISIPETVTVIELYAFSGCSSLESIEISENVTELDGGTAFSNCSSLESINVDVNNENYMSEDGVLFDKLQTEIIKYPEGKKDIKKYIIPEKVTTIGWMGFARCNNLESVVIPEGVTNIEYSAFTGCSSLKSISIPSSVTSIEQNAIPDLTIIYVNADGEGHRYAEENEQGYIIDDIAPTITFTPNIGENAQKEHNVKVEVQDNFEEVGVNENSLKYQWTQNEQQPTKGSFTESFENGQAIIKNTGDGAWYLWIYAEDNLRNETITRSEAFYFDNTAPNVNVEYSTKNPTKENVTVTITSNEEMQAIQGWTLSSDKKTLTKEYSANTKETITIKDLAGNETKVDIEINNIIMIGDINQDGRIDITDFLMLKRHLVAGNKTDWILTGSSLEAADMNENGTVDITDMLMLKRVVVENM